MGNSFDKRSAVHKISGWYDKKMYQRFYVQIGCGYKLEKMVYFAAISIDSVVS